MHLYRSTFEVDASGATRRILRENQVRWASLTASLLSAGSVPNTHEARYKCNTTALDAAIDHDFKLLQVLSLGILYALVRPSCRCGGPRRPAGGSRKR